jgi:hypothetical protein
MTKKQQYNHVRETLTPTPPPPKTWTTPTYHLERYTIRRNVKTVNVQLHGQQGNEKRTESISFLLLPNVPDAELVRAAVFFSPNKWTVSFDMNFSKFQGNFSKPLDVGLLNALSSKKQAQPTRAHTQPQPSPYNQSTLLDASPFQRQFQPPIPQPGQFRQPFLHTPQPPRGASGKRQGLWQWYLTRTRKMQISLAGAVILVLICISAIANATVGSGNTAPPVSPTATSPSTQQSAAPVDTPSPFPTPAPLPTRSPTVKQTPTVIVRTTTTPAPPKPTPTPSCQAVNGNPWCYNFSPGNYIFNPPSNFCDYFNCIASFWNGHGYVEECQDATYSLSGGIQGSCSHHGGNLRPLYSH